MKCEFCAEEIQDEAKKCKHCGEWLDGRNTDDNKIKSSQLKPKLTSSHLKERKRLQKLNESNLYDKKIHKMVWVIIVLLLLLVIPYYFSDTFNEFSDRYLANKMRGYDAMSKTDLKSACRIANSLLIKYPDRIVSLNDLVNNGFTLSNSDIIIKIVDGSKNSLNIIAGHPKGSGMFYADMNCDIYRLEQK